MQTEQHLRVTRYYFGGVAEVIDLESEKRLIGSASILSLMGCHVKTPAPFPQGRLVKLTITHNELTFTAVGGVADVTREGMGIAFRTIDPREEVILEEWLAQAAATIPAGKLLPSSA